MFIEIRSPSTGKLLLRYDPDRNLLEVRERGVNHVVDLKSVDKKRPAQQIVKSQS